MSKFMNGLNNDIPSPVEEGVVDWFKKKIGNKSNTSYDDDGNPINWFYIDFKALEKVLVKFDGVVKKAINDPAYKGIKPGFRKMSSSEYYIENNRHEELGTGLNTFKTKRVRDIEYKIGIYEIRYDKIFPKEEYLDLTPGAERGDISDAGRKFWKLVEDFQYLVSRYCQHTLAIGLVGADAISVNDWDDDPIVWISAVIKPKEIGKDTIKEATQNELFHDLTGKEIPVNEMSDNAAEALAVASAIGLVGLGMGLFSLVNKGIDKLFGNKKSSGSTKINRKSADTLKKLGKEFMDTQTIDSNERRNVYNDAIKLLKLYYPKEYVKKHFGISLIGGEWNEPSDFYKGKINICDFAFIHSASQEIPGYEEIRKKNLPDDEEDEQREIARNKYHKTIREMLNSINKDLTKKYKGKYRVYCEEFDDYWDIYGEGDGDEGVLIIADVDMINRMKSYVSNHATKESFTEVATESTATNVAKVLGWFAVLVGAAAYKRRKDNKEAYEKAKKEQEAMVKERSKEIAEYAKQTDYVAKHPVNTKERKAVLDYAYKVIEKAVDKCYISMLDTNGNWTSFTGENKDPLIPDVFCIDVCSLTPPEHLDYEYEEEWEKDVDPLVSDANKELQKKFGKKYSLVREDYMIFLIDTTYKAGLLNAVKENYTPFMDTYTAALEGWGIAFTRFAVKHNLPFANKLEDKIWEWSESTVNQLTNIPEFKEYILREAPKAYDEAYLRNNNLSINVNADMISEFEEEYEDSEAYHKVDKKNCCFCKKIGKFYVGVFGDKSHIHGVWLLMSDSKNKKIYAKALPAPEKELNKFKYQK